MEMRTPTAIILGEADAHIRLAITCWGIIYCRSYKRYDFPPKFLRFCPKYQHLVIWKTHKDTIYTVGAPSMHCPHLLLTKRFSLLSTQKVPFIKYPLREAGPQMMMTGDDVQERRWSMMMVIWLITQVVNAEGNTDHDGFVLRGGIFLASSVPNSCRCLWEQISKKSSAPSPL